MVYDLYVMTSHGWEYYNTYPTASMVLATQNYLRSEEWVGKYTRRNSNEARHVPIN